jgi:cell division protein FtsA
MEEIIEYIYFEIKNSGYEKKLIGGIVLTGGGALLKHIAQLTEFKTGMDTRIGYPNEHLANDVTEEMASPMYATGIGLVIVGIDRYEREKEKMKPEEVEEDPEPEEESTKTKKGKEKKPRVKKVKDPDKAGKKFTDSFIEKIQKWFEEENNE